MARAAASKAGPRLADVAGRDRRRRFGFADLDDMVKVLVRIPRGLKPCASSVTDRSGRSATPPKGAYRFASGFFGLLQRADDGIQRGVQHDGRATQTV